MDAGCLAAARLLGPIPTATLWMRRIRVDFTRAVRRVVSAITFVRQRWSRCCSTAKRRACSHHAGSLKRLQDYVALRVLEVGNFPAHRLLCDLRSLHLQELSAPYARIVKMAHECAPVILSTIAVDGSKVGANASRHEVMGYPRMMQAESGRLHERA